MAKMTQGKKDNALMQFAQLTRTELFQRFQTQFTGLTSEQAQDRLDQYGPNVIAAQQEIAWYIILWHAFCNPFSLVLAFLAIVSVVTGDIEPAGYMCVMIILSAIVAFVQEYKSQKASTALREMIENTTNVKRNGIFHEIPMDEVVPGDIIHLQTGDMVPADSILLNSKDLFINQSSLTGESYPIEKCLLEDLDAKEQIDWEHVSSIDVPNILFMGTDVLSGTGDILIVKTGRQTLFGDIASKSSTNAKVPSAFDKGLNRISRLLLTMVAILFPLVFIINWLTKSSPLDAFFFAIAVAVGLTPEMLPMVVNTNLAKGAVALSKQKVIVKQLSAIQNLGSMTILCTDKTGTITEDRVVMMSYVGPLGEKKRHVLHAAFVNSYFQTGWKNLMDIAVIQYFNKHPREFDYSHMQKVDEIPFDFQRRRLSVVVREDNKILMVTKGAVEEVEAICTHMRLEGRDVPITPEKRKAFRNVSKDMNKEGMRVLTVAQRLLTEEELANFDEGAEEKMTLIGFLGFLDPAKASAKTAIESLHKHGVAVKVLTGDNAIVAKKVCADVGIPVATYYLGADIDAMSDQELFDAAMQAHLFAKLSPLQKARIIDILRQANTVGFMGDGINDAPALRAADVGISVDTAADITKEASSIILLEKSLQVLETAVVEGRSIFSNMMKYLRITLSSNFGNVFSVLVASAFLPFLPMLSTQLLTLNLIYDLSQLATPWDCVDEQEIAHPVKWDTKGLAQFALRIGPISSLFDVTTFAILWFVMHYQTPIQAPFFQSAWFIESLATQALAFHILRTKKLPFIKSNASLPVFLATFSALAAGAILLLTPLGNMIQLYRIQTPYLMWWLMIVFAYCFSLQIGKWLYYKNLSKTARN
ncbi:magnesium-translocating P-type ATPase [Streptococcus halichoeri]|uniref:magnesium-translocating P-type ATPase n=1 Tax=Streptococcus halichoeri TaxID=254785 RepID=UPI00135A93F3|nr:magnesium-translocating P-type ATPase [Streptococcus halichoeri]